MQTAKFIRRHINGLQMGQIITSKAMMVFGKRSAVDQALYRFVQTGLIVRLARGVFCRLAFNTPLPSVFEVASAKAKAFGKEILEHDDALLKRLGIEAGRGSKTVFAVVGSSSSFMYGQRRIFFRGIAPRKARLGSSRAGLTLRGLWYWGERNCTEELVRKNKALFMRTDHEELHNGRVWMPAWLTDYFPWRPQRTPVDDKRRWIKLLETLKSNAKQIYLVDQLPN